MKVAITVLGRFAVAVDGHPVDPAHWHRRSAAALVKVLAMAPGHRLHREQVMDRLWPDVPVDDAAPRLHKAAHYARRALGEARSVVLAGEIVSLFPDRDIQVDAVVFQQQADAAISTVDEAAAGRAADLYGGDLLPDDLYEDWTVDARERLRSCYLTVLRAAGRWEILAREEPADEQAHLRIITALAGRGDHRGALRQYERLERALRSELGVAPGRAAVALRAQLVAAEAAATRSPAGRTTAVGATPGGATAVISPAVTVTPVTATSVTATSVTATSVTATAGTEAGGMGAATAPPPPVGRDGERDRIRRLLATVTAGTGRTLFISGPPGIGKTALLDWLERTATELGMRVGSGVAAQVEGAWPYAPVLEAVADLSRRHPTLLDGLDDALRGQIEMGLSGRHVGWTAQGGHQRLYVAVAELLRLAAAGAGAVLVIDDAHLADDASLRLLHYLARSTAAERVLVVIAHRPEPPVALADIRRSLLGRASAEAVELGPLSQRDVSLLVQRLSGPPSADFTDAVMVASGGVPFAVVELVRSGLDPLSLPSRSLSLGALSTEQITALAAAAILGNAFDTDEFLAVADLSDDAAYGVLDTARSQQLVVRTETGYAFRHSLLRDAVVERLPVARRRSLHRRAADALMTLDRSAARIGHHLVEAGDRSAAAPWMLRAAETSAALGAYKEALDILATVQAQVQGAELATLLAMRADLLMACADAGTVDAYREALAAVDQPTARARLRAKLARAAIFAGDLETATIALDGLTPDGSPEDAVLLLARGHLAFFRGDMEAAEAAATEARQRVTLGVPLEWQMFDLMALQGLVAHTRGEWFQRLRAELRVGVDRPALASRIFDSHLCVAEYLLYGPTPYEEVLELAAALRDTAERSGVLRAVAFATALRGETALLMGDLDLAETELLEAADLHRDIGSAAGEALSLQRLAEVALERGDRAQANRLLVRSIPLARFSNVSLHLIQRIYGTMIAAAADPMAAREVVARAEAALGLSDYCPLCSVMLSVPAARACADVGDLEDARRHLRAAEKSAANWEGTAWQASLLEVRAHLAAAEGASEAAERLLTAAADLFEASGQPLDARRCRR